MFDKIQQYWPQLTLLTIAISAFFNVGYFSAIGIHFIGLTDFSNVVYSLGLAFSTVMVGGLILMGASSEGFAKRLDYSSTRVIIRVMAKVVLPLIAGALILLFALIYNRIIGGWIIRNQPLDSLLFGISVVIIFSLIFDLWQKRQADLPIAPGDWLAVLIMLFLLTYSSGAYLATHYAHQTATMYKITNKVGMESIVRIVRSSSLGLLVSENDKIAFVPKEEIRRVDLLSQRSSWKGY
jgi:hypothetical protein